MVRFRLNQAVALPLVVAIAVVTGHEVLNGCLRNEPSPNRIFHGRPVRSPRFDRCSRYQIVTYEFDTFRCIWEPRPYGGNNAEQHLIGAYFYGTEGTFHMGWRDGWTFYPAKKSEKVIHVEPQLNDPDGQNIKELWADFLESIKAKRRPVRDVEIGHRASAAALLGMVSWRAGRSIKWEGVQIVGRRRGVQAFAEIVSRALEVSRRVTG